jgi:tetratricopeptide (TPR) repeat protein
MERPVHKIGSNVVTFALSSRRAGLLAGGFAVLLALLSPAPSAAWAEETVIKAEDWTDTGSYLAGIAALEQHDMKAAAALLVRALGDDISDVPLAQKTLVALMSAKRIPDAIALAKRLHETGIKSTLVMLVLVQEQARGGEYDDALALAKQLPDDRLMQIAGPMLRAWLALGAEGKDAALKELKPLSETSGAGMLAKMQTALIADQAGDAKRAAEDLLAAIDGSADIPAQLAEFYVTLMLREGDEQAARKMVERYREQAQGRGEDVATAMERQFGKPYPKKPLVADPKSGLAIAYTQIATELMSDDYSGDAMWLTQLALDLDPDLDIAGLALGDLYRQADHLDDAIAAYDAIPEDSIFRRPSQLSIAECYRRQDKFAEAETLLRGLMDADKSDISAAQQLGQLLRSNKKFKEAAEVYGVAIGRLGTLEEEDWQLFYYRGVAHERAKNWAAAERDFQKALELSPDEAYVLNYLAYSWVERKERLDEALPMLEKAVSQQPDEGFIIDSLGWAHFMLGRYPQAVQELEKAVSLSPTDPVLNEHLGDAYWKVGRHHEARFQWSRALSFEPEPELLPVLQKKLEEGLTEEPKVKSDAGESGSGG